MGEHVRRPAGDWWRWPTRPLAEAFDPRRNSFNLLRIVFACLVLFSHSFPLGGFDRGVDPMSGWSHGQETFGGLAVAGFFVVSGFLVSRSFDTTGNVLRYAWKRALRILPGFWVCLLVTAFVLAPIIYREQYGSLHGFLGGHPDSPVSYLRLNDVLWMGQYPIDGLLRGTPYQHLSGALAWDGSLWTLLYEVKCYLGVAVLGVFGVFRRGRFVLVGCMLVLWTVQVEQWSRNLTFLHSWPVLGDIQMSRLAFLFSIGAVLYTFRDAIPISDLAAAVAFVVVAVSFRAETYPSIGLPAFAYLCIWAAVRLPFSGYERIGDYSYGVYIYAFPVQQMLAYWGAQRWGLVPYVLLALLGSLVLAVPSWFLVEKPAMRLKRLRLPVRGAPAAKLRVGDLLRVRSWQGRTEA